MKKYTSEIHNLYYSTGHFQEEYRLFLKSLSFDDQNTFIHELYEDVTLFGIEDKLLIELERNHQDFANYRFIYSESDMNDALKNGEYTPVEALFKSDKDRLEYRATRIFIDRKRTEVKFALPGIKELYRSISKRSSGLSISNLIMDVQYQFEWHPLRFPEGIFSRRTLNQFLKTERMDKCFMSHDHYLLFKSNSFQIFNEDRPQYLSIPIISGKKMKVAKVMQNLYTAVRTHNKEYNNKIFDLKRDPFARVIMANFLEYRKNTLDSLTFKIDLKTTLSRMR